MIAPSPPVYPIELSPRPRVPKTESLYDMQPLKYRVIYVTCLSTHIHIYELGVYAGMGTGVYNRGAIISCSLT